MKSLSTSLIALGLCGTLLAAEDKPPSGAGQFKNERDRMSYSLGMNIGSSLKMQGADVNVDELANGIRDVLGGKAKLTEQEMRQILTTWQQELRTKRMEQMRAEGEKNKEIGAKWLAENAKKPGVKSFPSGLQYKVLVSGKGPQPKAEDSVSAHYKGTLMDGTQFDSSYERGKPLVTPVRGVIPGWQEALTNMHVGDKWELYIPSHLAYGERGSPPKISPNAPLVFEMELLGIEPPNANAASGAPQIRVQPSAPGGQQQQQIRIQPNQ